MRSTGVRVGFLWENFASMSEATGSRAAELAAGQVESIVAAAQEGAEQLTAEAQREAEELRERGRQEAAQVLEAAQAEAGGLTDAARQEADHTRAEARREARELTEGARHHAEELATEAQRQADQLREQSRREAESRVAEAEEASTQVLAEARSRSGGLNRLGLALSEQGERLLRDVQAAHRRMQSDLRVESPRRASATEREPSEKAPERRPRSRSRNPLELDVPNWVGPDR
jgi:cell division septum initiation protein DivIVA